MPEEGRNQNLSKIPIDCVLIKVGVEECDMYTTKLLIYIVCDLWGEHAGENVYESTPN